MSTGQIEELLHELRQGKLDASTIELFAGARLSDFIAGLRSQYPILFQERTIGRKHELGMAQSVRFQLTPFRVAGSRFLSMHLRPVLHRCVLVSGYGDLISEVAQVSGIRIRPHCASKGALILKTGRGYKLDKSDDSWLVKSLEPKAVNLSEDFLVRRGWNFAALVPPWA